jgi:TPR repeat protein
MDAPPAAAAPKPCCVCDAPNGKHCMKCKSRHYCGKACQLFDWKQGHNKACKLLAAAFQDRLLDELMPKKVKEEPAIVEDVLLADGSKAAARLSAVRTTAKAEVKASALNDVQPDWRGTCAICLDRLPLENDRQTFYSCCCKRICKSCSDACVQHDARCPLCRTPGRKSDAELVRRMQTHVDNGHAEAQVRLGDSYLAGAIGLKQSFTRAFQLYELAAAQGDAGGQARLGRSYELGQGVKINHEAAALWYRRAAEQGFPEAQNDLGVASDKGQGVAQSHEEAVRWYRLAAAQGHTGAVFNLGACYGNGDGVARDLDEAMRLFKRAAAQGHARAAANADSLAAFFK